jgi:hypothetical protein
MMNKYVFKIKANFFMVADLEPELEYEVSQETLLAVLEDAHLLQGLQVHVHRDLSLRLSLCAIGLKRNWFFFGFSQIKICFSGSENHENGKFC